MLNATARYWRAYGLAGYDSRTLALSEFQLFNAGARVDAGVTLTANIAPTTGTLASLQDGSTAASVSWVTGISSLVLSWDMGSAVTVDDVRLGTSTNTAQFLRGFGLQYSSTGLAGSWSEFRVYRNILIPAPSTLTQSAATGVWDPVGTMAAGGSLSGFGIIDDSRASVATSGASNNTALRTASSNSSGVMQIEVDFSWTAVNTSYVIGIQLAANSASGNPSSSASGGWGFVPGSATKYANGIQNSYSTAFAASSTYTVGVVVDFTAGSLTFYKNGVSLGVAYTGLTLTAGIVFCISTNGSGVPVTTVVRSSGFTYPIAGAAPWDTTTTINTLYKTYALPMDFVSPSTATVTLPGTVALPSGIGTVPWLSGFALGNFLTDVPNPVWQYASGQTIVGPATKFGTITGHVTVSGAPARKRVCVYRDADSQCFGNKWSDPATGLVSFAGLSVNFTYTGVAYDDTGAYQAIVWNSVRPV